MCDWVNNLRVLNISADNDSTTDQRLPGPHKDNARQTLQAFLGAGLGGRDDAPLESEWVTTEPTGHVRLLTDNLSIADPFDDEIHEVLPSLVAAQRSDAFFVPVFIYLEVATTDQSDAWLKAAQPADPLQDGSTRDDDLYGDFSGFCCCVLSR